MTLIDEIMESIYECKVKGIEPDSVLIGADKFDAIIETAMTAMSRPPVSDLIAFKDLSKPVDIKLMGLQVYRSIDFSGVKVFKK